MSKIRAVAITVLAALFVMAFILAGCGGPDMYESYLGSDPQSRAGNLEATSAAFAATASYYYGQATDTVQAQAVIIMATREAEVMRATAAYEADRATSTAAYEHTRAAQMFAVTQAAIVANNEARTAQAASLRVTQTAGAARAALALEQEQWDTRVNGVRKAALWIALSCVLIAALVMAVILGWRRINIENSRRRFIAKSPSGDSPLLLIEGPYGTAVYDADRNPLPYLRMTIDGATYAPQVAPLQLQAETTRRDQAIDLAKSLAAGGRGGGHSASQMVSDEGEQQAAAPDLLAAPPDAPWTAFTAYNGNEFPLGMSTHGIITANPFGTAPHLLMAGASGSGKTHFGLTPVIARALATGWQVVCLSRNGHGFGVFEGHPNAHIILLDDADDAVLYLRSLYDEIQRRIRLIAERNIRSWDYWPERTGPFVLVVLDEYSNLTAELEDYKPDHLHKWANAVASEGRKAGVVLALALQDPTHKSLDVRIRRNCTCLAFYVREQISSQVILGAKGAESLPNQRHFLAVTKGLQRGLAFDGQDEQVQSYLAAHPVEAMATPVWTAIGGVTRYTPGDVEVTEPQAPPEVVMLAERIRPLWERGESKRQMALAAGGTYAGAFAFKLDAAITYLGATTTTDRGATAVQ